MSWPSPRRASWAGCRPLRGATSSVALVGYFLVAITMHLRARDLGRRNLANASGLAVVSGAITWCLR